jgi:hypothetical protein
LFSWIKGVGWQKVAALIPRQREIRANIEMIASSGPIANIASPDVLH